MPSNKNQGHPSICPKGHLCEACCPFGVKGKTQPTAAEIPMPGIWNLNGDLCARPSCAFRRFLGGCLMTQHSVDGRNPFAPPKKKPANTNTRYMASLMFFRWCELGFVHPQYKCFCPLLRRKHDLSPVPGLWPLGAWTSLVAHKSHGQRGVMEMQLGTCQHSCGVLPVLGDVRIEVAWIQMFFKGFKFGLCFSPSGSHISRIRLEFPRAHVSSPGI